MSGWWRGTQLVAGRALGQNLRSRSFKVVTGLLLLLSIAVVVVPRLLTDQAPTYTLATIEPTSPPSSRTSTPRPDRTVHRPIHGQDRRGRRAGRRP